MSLITQLETINAGLDILNRSGRTSAQFINGANALLSELATWEASLATAGLDSDTLTEVTARKDAIIASITNDLTALITALGNA